MIGYEFYILYINIENYSRHTLESVLQYLMFGIFIFLLLLSTFFAYEVIFAVNSGSFSYAMISTKYFNYTVDSYFQGLASINENKPSIPQTISQQSDRQLIKTHRTTANGYTSFSYRPIITEQTYYIAVISMIETQFKGKGQRVFQIKLGDQVVHTVDLVSEVGFGKILHKWIQIDIRQDIAYLNGTLPALNAFNYKNKQLRIVFESVKNKPKIEALMLLKGSDSHQYLTHFLQHQQQKSTRVKEYLSEKYRKVAKLSYRPLLASDQIPPPESELTKLYLKFWNIKSLCSFLCGVFLLHHEKILSYVKNKVKEWIENRKGKKGNGTNWKKKN